MHLARTISSDVIPHVCVCYTHLELSGLLFSEQGLSLVEIVLDIPGVLLLITQLTAMLSLHVLGSHLLRDVHMPLLYFHRLLMMPPQEAVGRFQLSAPRVQFLSNLDVIR